ncbi:PIN domain-containing protein [Mucilaginibacter robiniae]|uniref:PIN domain-containing protein n=1 Tax=Mucilaginibacter robiniae TaxID=2728022 RepID=A0A7L5E370_9SPHI|nr:PIN domain-containing protein [Mucilaginibacter robiniae]QJD97732.1 PIN domain-containing protein [Mucilaginibacter robiniae]
MNDRVFLDSNILVYTYSSTEPEKQAIARQLVIKNNSFISTQVLQELCNIVTRKFKFSYPVAIQAIEECSANNDVHVNSGNTVLQACRVADRYGFSFYDSLIIAAAIESNCSILYSEDMRDGQLIEGVITIKNPFK